MREAGKFDLGYVRHSVEDLSLFKDSVKGVGLWLKFSLMWLWAQKPNMLLIPNYTSRMALFWNSPLYYICVIRKRWCAANVIEKRKSAAAALILWEVCVRQLLCAEWRKEKGSGFVRWCVSCKVCGRDDCRGCCEDRDISCIKRERGGVYVRRNICVIV